jgi:hypothetical protein
MTFPEFPWSELEGTRSKVNNDVNQKPKASEDRSQDAASRSRSSESRREEETHALNLSLR